MSSTTSRRPFGHKTDILDRWIGKDDSHTLFRFTSAEEADDEDCEDGDADGGVEAVAFDGEADDSEEYAGDGGGDQQEDA